VSENELDNSVEALEKRDARSDLENNSNHFELIIIIALSVVCFVFFLMILSLLNNINNLRKIIRNLQVKSDLRSLNGTGDYFTRDEITTLQ